MSVYPCIYLLDACHLNHVSIPVYVYLSRHYLSVLYSSKLSLVKQGFISSVPKTDHKYHVACLSSSTVSETALLTMRRNTTNNASKDQPIIERARLWITKGDYSWKKSCFPSSTAPDKQAMKHPAYIWRYKWALYLHFFLVEELVGHTKW
jgi:hypothetical protein